MVYFEKLIKAKFLRRYKRFFMDCELSDGKVVVAHCPNTGSMKSLLDKENHVYLLENNDPKKKLRYSSKFIVMNKINLKSSNACNNNENDEISNINDHRDYIDSIKDIYTYESIACIDTHLPNKLVFDAINSGEISEFLEFDFIEREKKYGYENSKIDILLSYKNSNKKVYIEVKNVTLIEEDLPKVAQFPDSISSRGAKHLRELRLEAQKGNRAIMFYLVNISDGNSFKIAEHIDKVYNEEFDRAKRHGVEILIYKSKIIKLNTGEWKINIGEKLDFYKG